MRTASYCLNKAAPSEHFLESCCNPQPHAILQTRASAIRGDCAQIFPGPSVTICTPLPQSIDRRGTANVIRTSASSLPLRLCVQGSSRSSWEHPLKCRSGTAQVTVPTTKLAVPTPQVTLNLSPTKNHKPLPNKHFQDSAAEKTPRLERCEPRYTEKGPKTAND
jgi:hypothetical protein